jgi:exosome complex RNA-binding protein Csl4
MKTTEIPTIIPKAGAPIVKITTRGEVFFAAGCEKRGADVHVFRCGHLGFRKLHGEIVEVELLTETEYLALFMPETIVVVPKYGDTYRGRVVEVRRKRVLVRFMTRGGKVKEIAFPVRDVGIAR